MSKDSAEDVKSESFGSSTAAEAVQYDKGVDEAVDLVAGRVDESPLDSAESTRLRKKIDWVVLPALFLVYALQQIDKSALGASAVLGVIKDNKLTMDEFNTVGSAFSIGYIVFAYPHSWALQRFPVGKYLGANIILWAVLLGLHPLCKSFAGLFVLRFFLGASEGCIMNGVMLVTSMFYTRTEAAERVGWTFLCNGVGTIVSSFIAFGAGHVKPTSKPSQWQLLMIVDAGLTLVVGIWFILSFPDSPVKAKFLTTEEKINAVKRVQDNKTGTETKTWKREQLIEALTDIKTWLFFLAACFANLQNGAISTQYALIIQSFGFTVLQTTLLSIPIGFSMIFAISLGMAILRRNPNSRTWIAIVYWFPCLLGAILLITLPWKNRVGLIISFYVFNLGGSTSFVICMGWAASTTAGHTKKLAVHAAFVTGYALGQILCTQFWRAQYKPRNYVPWGINIGTYAFDIAILLTIRYVLNKENKRRDALQASGAVQDDYGYVETVDSDGIVVRQKVDKGLLDLTDRQNLSFRYVL